MALSELTAKGWMYAAGLDLVAFTLVIDDIVFPDGHTLMGVLGGGGAP